MTPSVAVVGAGPAGLMAAETLARAGAKVTVFERMPSVGRKFLLAGRGGLNLTHSEAAPAFLARYGAAAPRLEPAIAAFPPEALRAWCEELGQPTFVGSSGRVFPRALKTSPLLRAWLGRLDGLGVEICLRHRWEGWDDKDRLLVRDAAGDPRTVACDAAVLALGGASWPRLGGDGAWTGTLADRGVEVAPLRPANCGFAVAWSDLFRDRFAGQPLKTIALAFAGRRVRGEAVVTAQGLEGGAVYGLAGVLREAFAGPEPVVLTIDLKPGQSQAALVKRLAKPRKGQSLSNHLRKAAGLSPVAANLLREATDNKLPGDAATLAGLIKALPLELAAPLPLARAISTAGGVAFEALGPDYMLRARPGVFLAGEMLDWEAPTGGYLLQACFATGRAAAQDALAWLARQPG